jgi:hypothetical protein
MPRRDFWGYLKCGVLLGLLPSSSSGQQPAAADKNDSAVADAIGKAVLGSVRQYEERTGKQASTVLIHLSGRPPHVSPPQANSGNYTQLNQEHFTFTIEVESAPNSK